MCTEFVRAFSVPQLRKLLNDKEVYLNYRGYTSPADLFFRDGKTLIAELQNGIVGQPLKSALPNKKGKRQNFKFHLVNGLLKGEISISTNDDDEVYVIATSDGKLLRCERTKGSWFSIGFNGNGNTISVTGLDGKELYWTLIDENFDKEIILRPWTDVNSHQQAWGFIGAKEV